MPIEELSAVHCSQSKTQSKKRPAQKKPITDSSDSGDDDVPLKQVAAKPKIAKKPAVSQYLCLLRSI